MTNQEQAAIFPVMLTIKDEGVTDCIFANDRDELLIALNKTVGTNHMYGKDYNQLLINDAIRHIEEDGTPFYELIGECCYLEIHPRCYCKIVVEGSAEDE